MKINLVKMIQLTIVAIPWLAVANSSYADVAQNHDALLLNNGKTVVRYDFMASKKVILQKVSVNLQVSATVTPKALATTLQKLRNTRLSPEVSFDLVSISQSMTANGLVDINAQLNAKLPLVQMPTVYTFVKAQSGSGVLYKVVKIEPYLSDLKKQAVINELSFNLYQQAMTYSRALNNQTGQNFRLAKIDYQNQLANKPTATFPRPMAMVAGDGRSSLTGLSMTKKITLDATVVFLGNQRMPFSKNSASQVFQHTSTPKFNTRKKAMTWLRHQDLDALQTLHSNAQQ